MTREQVNQQLRYLEHLRHLSMEADSVREKCTLDGTYRAIWRSIQPYATGAKPYSDERVASVALAG